MARVRQKDEAGPAAAVAREAAAPGPAPAAAAAAEERPIAASTVTLRFDERGEPLPAKGETMERAREWLERMGALEVEPEPAAESGAVFVDEALVGHLLHGVNLLQAGLVRGLVGLPFDQAFSALRFSDKEVSEVAPAAVAVLEKRLPGWLAGHQEVIGLGVTLAALEASKLEALRKLLQERGEEAVNG